MINFRIGVDIGGTGIKIGIVDEQFQIVRRSAARTPDTFEDAMKTVAELIYGLADEMGLSIHEFRCAGIGVPCAVVPETGQLVLANNTHWKDVSIKKELSRHLPIPLYFGNDANCAVIGETMAGAARGKKNVVMLTLGTGVGSGVILDGKLFTGGDGFGPEIGHMPIQYHGVLCTCGLRGCLESYASATGLIRQIREALAGHPESAMNDWIAEHGEINGQTAFDCAKTGDPTALEVVRQYASYVATGLGGATNIFRPELIILGGGISNAGDFLLDRIRTQLPQYILAYDVIGGPPLQKAILGNDAGIIGAAFLDLM